MSAFDPPRKCPYCDDTFRSSGGLSGHVIRQHADRPTLSQISGRGRPPGARQEPASSPEEPAGPMPGQESFEGLEEPPAVEEEVVPAKPGRVSRWRARWGRRTSGSEVVPSRERSPRGGRRTPGVSRRRLPLDADISDVWAFAARRLEPSPHYATGRMLQYQAPAAGVILDRAVAGTLPDRVIFQPLARNRDKYEDVGFLLAGPLLTFSITTTIGQIQGAQEAGDVEAVNDLAAKLAMQREMFAWVLSMMLPRLAVGAKLAADKKAKRDAAIADAFPELGDDDPVEALVTMLFQPPATYEEAAHNGKADRATSDPGEQGAVQFGSGTG